MRSGWQEAQIGFRHPFTPLTFRSMPLRDGTVCDIDFLANTLLNVLNPSKWHLFVLFLYYIFFLGTLPFPLHRYNWAISIYTFIYIYTPISGAYLVHIIVKARTNCKKNRDARGQTAAAVPTLLDVNPKNT